MKLILWLGLICPAFALGQGAEEAALQKIEDIQKALKSLSLSGAPICEVSSNPRCNFDSYCSAVAPNRLKSYVYDDGAGNKLPNYNLLFMQDQLSLCQAAQGKKIDHSMPNESDPFANPYLLMGESGKKYDSQFKAGWDRMQSLSDDLKKRMVKVLEKRKNGTNNQAVDNMISRVKRVKIEALRPQSEEELYDRGCFLPNASFKPDLNTIVVCPQMLGAPEGALTMVMAHELGHTIDTCLSSMPIINNMGHEALAEPSWDGVDNLVRAVPNSKYPLASVTQCLQKPSSMNIKVRTNADKRKDLEEYQEGLKAEGFGGDGDVELNKIQTQMRKFDEGEEESLCPQSDDDKAAGYLQESFADWMSAQVIADKLQDARDPAKAKALALESQLIGLQSDCGGFTQDQKEAVIKQVRAAGCKTGYLENLFSLDKSDDNEDHPGWRRRISKIFMAQPEIQKALGCQAQKNTVVCN